MTKEMKQKGRTWRKRQKKRSCDKPTSLAEKPEYVALYKWAKTNGVIFHQMKPCLFPGIGRGLMATSQINIGDTLVSVPTNLLITESMIRRNYFRGYKPKININTIDLLCIFLIVEWSLGTKSFWFPYIDMLPNNFNTPSYFSEKDVKILPPFLYEQCCAQVKKINVCLVSLKQLLGCVSIEQTGDIPVTFENVRWAWNVVNTRSVYMDCEEHLIGNKAMCCALAPLLDLLNHSSDVEVQASFSKEAHCYNICTKTRFARGNQVFINYGPHNNRKLLVEYGFILPQNCQNSINIEPLEIYDIISRNYGEYLSEKKHNILRKYKLEDSYSCTPSGLSWSLKTALKIMALNETKLQNKSLNIEDVALTPKERVSFLMFSKSILKSLLENCNLYFARIRSSYAMQEDPKSSQDRMNLVCELLTQENKILTNALTMLK